MYGFKESGDLAPGKQGGKFGLNTGAFITKFEYNANAGKDGAAADAIDFSVQVGEREYRHRLFPVTKVYKDNNELTDTSSEEYKGAFEKEMQLFNAYVSDIVKVFVPVEDLKVALATPISSFKDYAQIVTGLVQRTPNWNKKPVDVFLQYQYTPSGDNQRTFLELPKNVKHGSMITASEGPVTEVRTDSSLSYDKEDGTKHPFKRGQWFLESAFSNPINLTQPEATINSSAAGADANW